METDKVTLEDKGPVALVRLSNGVTNAIGPDLVAALSGILGRVKASHGGMVLAGGNKFFSIGLDIPNLLPLDRSGMRDFWYAFDGVILDLFTLPVPTACAVRRHAVAGGTILALACDWRFAAPGRTLMGLNEIRLGLPVPYLAHLMLRQIAGDRNAAKLLFLGDLVDSETAHAMGLVDGIYPEGDVETVAVQKITQMTLYPKAGFSAIKENRVERVKEHFETHREAKTKQLLDLWFSPSAQRLLEEAAQKF